MENLRFREGDRHAGNMPVPCPVLSVRPELPLREKFTARGAQIEFFEIMRFDE